jgi:cytochrome c-type biogenesis protein
MTAGAGIGLVVAFLAGVVSFASPCCLPLVPAYIGYMVGATGASDRRRSFLHGLAFVAGFTIVFVAFWASIGAIGYVLADSAKYLRVIGGAVLIVLGLQVAGVIIARCRPSAARRWAARPSAATRRWGAEAPPSAAER